jgi:hypothetical protein
MDLLTWRLVQVQGLELKKLVVLFLMAPVVLFLQADLRLWQQVEQRLTSVERSEVLVVGLT